MRRFLTCVLSVLMVLSIAFASRAEAQTFTRILDPEVTVATTGDAHSGWTYDVVDGRFEYRALGYAPGGEVRLKFIEPPEVIQAGESFKLNIVPDAQFAESPTEQLNESLAEPTMVEAAVGHAPSNLSDAYIGYLPGPLVPNTNRQIYSLAQRGASTSVIISEGSLAVSVHVRIHGGYLDFVPEAGDTQFEHIFTITWRYVTGSVAVTDTIPSTSVPLDDGSEVHFSAVVTYVADFDGARLELGLRKSDGAFLSTRFLSLPRSATPQTITVQMTYPTFPLFISPEADGAKFEVWLYHEFLLVEQAESLNYSVEDWPIVVDNLQNGDDGDYSQGKQTLREALKRAGQKTYAVTIPVKVSGTIPVTADPVFLSGTNTSRVRLLAQAGPVTLSDQGQAVDSLLVVDFGKELEVVGVTFNTTGGGSLGGTGIWSGGTLIARNCIFDNPRNLGAAIISEGPVELHDCQFEGTWDDCVAVMVGLGGEAKLERCHFNVASAGGFIAVDTFGAATIRDCEFSFSGNVTAIRSNGPELVDVTDSAFEVNTLGSLTIKGDDSNIAFFDCLFQSDAGSDGSFRFEDGGNSSSMNAWTCLFINRGSQTKADCLVQVGSDVFFEALNCIFSGSGSGVRSSGLCSLAHCTLLSAGTAFTAESGSELTLAGSILAGSISRRGGGASSPDLLVKAGAFVLSSGHNAIENPGPGFNPTASDIVGRDLHVRPTTTGGITLMAYSPCVNAGTPNFDPTLFDPPLLTDVSGNVRVVKRIDIGAIEVSDLLLEALALVRADPAFDKNKNGIPDLVDVVSGIDPNKDAVTDPPTTIQSTNGAAAANRRLLNATTQAITQNVILETRVDERAESLQAILQTSTDLITWTDRAVYTPNGTDLGYTRSGENGVSFVEHEHNGYCWLIREAITVNGGSLFVRVKGLALP